MTRRDVQILSNSSFAAIGREADRFLKSVMPAHWVGLSCLMLLAVFSSTTLAQGSLPSPSGQTGRSTGGPAPVETAGENIVAVVNGEPITRSELGQLCLARWGEETLESLVNKFLIMQECERLGVTITNKDIDEEVRETAAKFKMSPQQWLDMLKAERDVSAEAYRRDIVWPRLALKGLAASQLQVSQQELQKELESEYGAKVQVRMISLTSRSKAQEVLQKAQANPDDFPRLAKEFSEDPSTASVQGLIPPVRRHLGEPAIEEAVFALQKGEISGIVEAANQFLIFRCERHLPASNISPQFRQAAIQQAKDRIVERNLRDAATDLFQRLQQQSSVVNVLNDPALRQQHPGVAALVNQRKLSIEQLTNECVDRYGRDMLETEINYRLLRQALAQRSLNVEQTDLQKEIARAAASYGYVDKNGQADVQRWVNEVTDREGIGQREYLRDAVWPSVALKMLVGDRVTVTEDDLLKGFEANYGERVEVLAIVVGNQRMAQEVWDMARKESSNEFFGQLAEQYSIEPVSRANYGEIPPIRRHGGEPLIEKEAFSLQPGELSGIVALSDRFIIMKCLGRTEPVVTTPDAVRTELTADIREKKLRMEMARTFDQLRSEAQIDNFIEKTSQSGKTKIHPASTSKSIRRSDRSAKPSSQPPRPILVKPRVQK